jgi:hypothetical protein
MSVYRQAAGYHAVANMVLIAKTPPSVNSSFSRKPQWYGYWMTYTNSGPSIFVIYAALNLIMLIGKFPVKNLI